ncbi:unnamed protein product [Didymodactylos carnosus]|uniref:Uncharacterized protein n=1 Tax=Didymodactylos carnosus TaxID=1234261 RepID=A0A814PAF8_9BILA|nr:unnamed protein product [Didymodactylos carnosus]CAF1433304.1 unnamed protein product [Didymodactylos carnosus]CAF3866957.1 unnamed protein product [Didymodactylos carnosus]CAF4231078.1 unnamed protein product [Didymodactylos carnosus]
MSNNEWQVLNVVKTLDEVTALVQQHQVSKFRTSNLKTSTKYSYRCSQYRKYPLCRYDIHVNILDNNPDDIKILSKNVHSHQQHNTTTRLPSSVRESVAKYVKCDLTQTQMKSALSIDHSNIPLPSSQLSNIIRYNRRKNNPEIFYK